MKNKDEAYEEALLGKKIPILTLDNKWYKLFAKLTEESNIKELTQELNNLLKRQGKLNTESKEYKSLKKKLMNEIVTMVDEFEQSQDKKLTSKIDENKKLVEDCNTKLEEYEEELFDIPNLIQDANHKLMIATMEYCYTHMQENTEEILEISNWIVEIKEELKMNIRKKQEKEYYNHIIYSYMHDIFGPDVIDLFDMKYNPLEQHPKVSL